MNLKEEAAFFINSVFENPPEPGTREYRNAEASFLAGAALAMAATKEGKTTGDEIHQQVSEYVQEGLSKERAEAQRN